MFSSKRRRARRDGTSQSPTARSLATRDPTPGSGLSRHSRRIGLFLILGAVGVAADDTGVEDDSGRIEEVVVTGTWIPGTPEDDPLPVSSIDREALAAEGSPSVIELVRNLSFSQGADGESDQYGSRTGADRATVNLRGLGPSRSLVLLNSRRLPWSPGSVPDQAQLVVDVNLLPMAALERLEVLRDGATATYGSDAIAGVVNFITRSDFDGIELEARHKALDSSDGDQWLGLIAGTALAGGNAVTSFGFARRSPLLMVERDWAVRSYAENPRGGWSGTGTPAIFVPLEAFAETAGDAAGMRNVAIVDPNCERLGGAHTNVPATRPQGGVCRFQYTPFVNLVQDTRRWQWFSEASWEFDNGLHLSGELLVAETDVPNWTTSPSYPPSEVIDPARRILAGHPALVDMASRYPNLYGDYAYCDAAYCRWQGDGAEQDAAGIPPEWQAVAWINGRHFGQNGPTRGHPRQSATARAVMEAEWDWRDTRWHTAFTYARSRRLEEDGAGLHYRSLRSLLGLGGYDCESLVPNRFDEDGNLHLDWRTVRDHAGQGPCRYWSPFSNAMPAHPNVPNATNPDYEPAFDQQDLASYLLTDRGFKGRASLVAIDTVVNGNLSWQLPGGRVAFAAGAQIRHESYFRREYSAETGPRGGALQDLTRYPCRGSPALDDCSAGRTGVFVYLPPGYDADADRMIYSVFGETGLPFSDTLDGQLSVRYEVYPDQGLSSLDPKAAVRWQVSPSITLRASAGTAFRAPTINQIEPGIASTSRQFVTRIATFKPILALGNPDVEPEAASTFNVGAIVDREGLFGLGDRLFLSVDYWRYAFEKPLVLEPYVRVLDVACPPGQALCDSGSPYFDRIDFGGRAAVSDISAISVSVVNGPDVDTDGVDFKAEYSAIAGWGEWRTGIAGTRTLSWEINGWLFGPAYDAIGRLNYDTSLARTVVDWKHRTWVAVTVGDLDLRWTAHYTADYKHDGNSEPGIDAHTTHDITAAWTFMDNRFVLDLGIFNVADREPPRVYRQLNYDPLAHNPLGRIVQVGVQWRI